MKKNKCKLCKHEWFSRTNNKPIECPKCKRYDWDSEASAERTEEIHNE